MRTTYRIMLFLGLVAMAGLVFAQPPVSMPPIPTGVQATEAMHGMFPFVELKWDAPMGGLFFRVHRATDDTTSFSALSVTNARAYDDFLVTPGHTYYYYVTSISLTSTGTVESDPSAIVSLTVKGGTSRPHGVVDGTVTDSVTGMPLPFVRVFFYRFIPMTMHPMIPTFAWPMPPAVWTDSLGHYSASLDTGGYFIRAVAWHTADTMPQYFPEWYKDARTIDMATKVAVADSDTVAVNFDLERIPPVIPVHLTGTVRDTAGNPLSHAMITVLRSIQDFHASVAAGSLQPADEAGLDIDDLGFMRGVAWRGFTDTLGHYDATVFTGKPYIVAASKKSYQTQFYNMKSSPSDADVLVLSGDTSGIDFALNLIPNINNSVAGSVRDTAGTGVQSRVVLIPLRPQPAGLSVRFTNTDSTGVFLFNHIRTGKYIALAIPYDNFAPAFYKAGAFGVIRWKDADTITVSGAVTGIDIGVVPIQSNGVISVHGRAVTNGNAGVQGANVFLVDAQGAIAGYSLTDAMGGYAITMVSSGSYNLVVDKDGYSSSPTPVAVSGSSYDVPVSDVAMSPDVPTGVNSQSTAPESFQLDQNYPNPFNPTTMIEYTIAGANGQGAGVSDVRLVVYDILGRAVATLVNEKQAPGTYKIQFNGAKLASGVYYYRLTAGNFETTRSMLLLK